MPFGKCIFLKGKTCSIHEVKPLGCEIGNLCVDEGEDLTAWFGIKFFLNLADPQSVRDYATYLKTGGKLIEGGSLEEMIPDTKKREAILNYEILR